MCSLYKESWNYFYIQWAETLFSRTCVSLFQKKKWEYMLYREISDFKTNTELPNRMVFNVCIQLTELNWCVFAGVPIPFLWRSGKRIFPAECKHFPNSCKSPSKTQNERIFQTARLGVRLPKGVESASRFREWEARCFSKLRFDMPEWMGVNAVWRNICF